MTQKIRINYLVSDDMAELLMCAHCPFHTDKLELTGNKKGGACHITVLVFCLRMCRLDQSLVKYVTRHLAAFIRGGKRNVRYRTTH